MLTGQGAFIFIAAKGVGYALRDIHTLDDSFDRPYIAERNERQAEDCSLLSSYVVLGYLNRVY